MIDLSIYKFYHVSYVTGSCAKTLRIAKDYAHSFTLHLCFQIIYGIYLYINSTMFVSYMLITASCAKTLSDVKD